MYRCLSIATALLALTLCSWATSYSAQEQIDQTSTPKIYNGGSNEDAKTGLDDVAVAAGSDKSIIMIAHLGTKEVSHSLSRRRLRTARDYLKYTRSIAPLRIIIAEGEPVKGQGRVEAYIDGKLYRIFVMVRNKDFAPEP